VVREWRLVNELNADVEGRGMASERFKSNGIRSSMVSGSGGATRGDNKENERLWI
jgi:hypothetical protein